MAIIKDPLYIKYRSTHGAITGATRFSQTIARRHSVPIRRVTFNQQKFTSTQSSIISKWRSLSISEQQSWTQFGIDNPSQDKYGNNIILSGWNWFSTYNVRRKMANLPIISSPPPDSNNNYDPITDIYQPIGSLHYHLYADIVPSNDEFIFTYRAINQPFSFFSPPYPILPYKRFFNPDFPLPVVLYHYEIQPGPRVHHFSTISFDNYCRKGYKINFKIYTGV